MGPVARMIGERTGMVLGQPIVVENHRDGGGIVGSQAAARAAPDGDTPMVGYAGTHGTNPAVRKLPCDAVNDVTPIAILGGTPIMLVTPETLPVKTLAEFITCAKASSGKASFGSTAPRTLAHRAMEQLKVATDLDMQHVADRGIGPATTDMLGGQMQGRAPCGYQHRAMHADRGCKRTCAR